MNFRKIIYMLIVLVVVMLIFHGCETETMSEETLPEESEEESIMAIETLPDIFSEETTTEEPEDTTSETEENSSAPETTTKVTATTTAEEVKLIDKYINPLTGIKGTVDMSAKRPVAIMINNLKPSLPQEGISDADILYECLVEGGATRLMMVVMNYEELGVVGSVRSSRDYYLDLAQNHDAIYIHAGGSPLAYDNIQSRKINTIDGVNMALPAGVFYRDEERRKTMSLEHTLMTTGKGIVKAIEYKKYRTEIKEGFVSPLNLCLIH